jgi:hypothetical protein
MPFQRRAEVVLAEWREVERKLAGSADLDSADAEDLRADAARLRDEYQALVDAAIHAQRPQPPPFPQPAS